MNILGDKTIISLLNILTIENERKKEIINLLSYMDATDREGLLEDLLKLFSLQIDKEATLKRAKMVMDDFKHPGNFDWNQFNKAQEDVLKKIISQA